MDMITRDIQIKIEELLFKGKVIIIYGARRVGKTVLSKQILSKYDHSLYINCEHLQNKQMLETTNSERLKDIIGEKRLIVLDEAQTVENIGLVLKIIVDTYPGIQVIATGSSSFDLANRLSEPLTGRTRQFLLYPLSVNELRQTAGRIELEARIDRLLRFGLYPDVVHTGDQEAVEELNDIAGGYLYKDILQHQNVRKPELVINLLRALALQVGNEVSIHELANLLKENSHTVNRYLDILEKSFVIVRLPALSGNLRKEIAKNRKVYFIDLGIRNSLIQNFSPLNMRNDTGALWENFCVLERLKFLSAKRRFVNRYFWRTYDQKEIDYIEEYDGIFHAYEFKYHQRKRTKVPQDFAKTYPNHTFKVIDRGNFFDFI
jgi:predicted AAA+ superfamily ATPase